MDDLPSTRSSTGNELLVKTKLFDMDNNIASALAYVPLIGANIIFSIVWLVTEPKSNKYLRRHAVQSLVLNVGFVGIHLVLTMVAFTLGVIPFLGFLGFIPALLGLLVSLVYFGGNIYLMYCAYKGRRLQIPVVSDIAEQNS
ncbi:MAG: hypothetical protein U0103_06640 [Candidatus Obscuribacterales bacterium]|nr:hypothetical protein [Cyanobacteria bacterium SZAS LIN-5]RTL41424.1 MAG: hypothetical protein EKK48_13750 [Candidatus Melainabacteria bacterium]